MGVGFEFCSRCHKICMEGHQAEKKCERQRRSKTIEKRCKRIMNIVEQNGGRYISSDHDTLWESLDELCTKQYDSITDENEAKFKELLIKVLSNCYGGCHGKNLHNLFI